MPIVYVKGDLVEAPEKVIVHGCNAQGKMQSGVAKAVRAAWPNAYTAYMKVYNWNVNDPRKGNKLDTGIIIPAVCGDKVIVNAITQEYYGRDKDIVYVSYKAIRQAMIHLRILARVYDQTHIAMPKIGSGLGNGDWDTIAKIIEEELANYTVKVYIQ